jgi:AcrR family transcriptional regulator
MPEKKVRPRISQESGTDLLITAAIKLMRNLPLSKVTLREIAAEADLQTIHIKRYFGSRNDLLVACSERLFADIAEENIGKSLDDIFANFTNSKDVELRLSIISHLLSEGVPPSRFEDERIYLAKFAERIAMVNKVSPKTAQTFANILQLVIQGNQLVGQVNGLNPQDRLEIYLLLSTLSGNLRAAEQILDWK